MEDTYNLLFVTTQTDQKLALTSILSRDYSYKVAVSTSSITDMVRHESLVAQYDIVILDETDKGLLHPATAPAIELLQSATSHHPHVEWIFLSGQDSQRTSAARQAGAYACLPQPVATDLLALIVARALDVQHLKGASKTSQQTDHLIASSSAALGKPENVAISWTPSYQRLRSFYQASNALVLAQNLEQLPHEIIEGARRAAEADGVAMIVIDANGWIEEQSTTGEAWDVAEADVLRPNGISMQVIQTMQPVVINDTAQPQDRIDANPGLSAIRSALCLPITLRGRCIGVFWIYYRLPRQFTEAEVEVAQLYVNHAATVYHETRRLRVLEDMRRATEALAAAVELDDVLAQINHSGQGVFGSSLAMLLVYDNKRDQFIPSSSLAVNLPAEVWDHVRNTALWEADTVATILKHGWIGVENVADSYPFLGQTTRQVLEQIGARSFQGVRLHVGDEVFGVLYLTYRSPRSFTAEDTRTALDFASHAAQAIKKAQLLAGISQAHNTARVVASLTALEEDLERTLELVAHGSREVLDCDAVTIYVYDQSTDRLFYPPIMRGVRSPDRVTRFDVLPHTSMVFTLLQRSEPYIALDVAHDPLFQHTRFVHDEEIRSCVAIPLRVGQEKVGVMFVNYRRPHRFTPDDYQQILLFTNQAAVAIRNAQLYQNRQQRLNTLQALHYAGQAVTRALSLEQALKQIIKEALALVGGSAEPGCSSYLALVDEETQHLRFTVSYPPELLSGLQAEIGVIDLKQSERIGIVGRTVLTGRTRNIGDVAQDPDYIEYEPTVRSMLVVPIKDHERVIGALSLEHQQRSAFSREDGLALESLAGYAAIAIGNARLYTEVSNRREELQQTKRMLDARTAIAWMGMVSSTWRHAITNYASTIADLSALIEHDLRQIEVPSSIGRYLQQIEQQAKQIQTTPITASLGREQDTQLIPVNSMLRERVAQLARHQPLESIEMMLDLQLDDAATVLINVQWLRHVLGMLVDNAVEAMAQSAIRRLTITTKEETGGVQVLVSDTGTGIPLEIVPALFRTPIVKTHQDKGLGMGLLLAQTIIQAYGGEINVHATSSAGTTMRMWLPLSVPGTTVRDMTQSLAKTPELRPALEKLSVADQRVTEIFANVSHELRTPITAIQGHVENLLMIINAQGSLGDDQKNNLEMVFAKAREAEGLIENFLDLAYIQEGKTTFNPTRSSISAIVRTVVSAINDVNNSSAICVEELPEDDPLEALVDVEKLKRILDNLISNAIKFSDKRGIVKVRTERHQSHVRISITDTGIGIPSDQLDKIFDRYYRIDSLSTGRTKSVGIGLHIVRRFVELHKGRIRVESKVGHGSTFSILLPWSKERSEDGDDTIHFDR